MRSRICRRVLLSVEDPRRTPANAEVLAFYRQLPFNYRGSVKEHADAIARRDPILDHPPIDPLLRTDTRVLDVGCGVGWLSSAIALRRGSIVTGIDFNPVAIETAHEVAEAVGVNVTFEVADLFLYQPAEPFDVVVALGVLHHTDDCLAALKQLCTVFARPRGHVYVGLYHAYGRRPFAEHFARLQDEGWTEEQLLAEYRSLHSNLKEETHVLSWFRDQVLHPKETHHTLEELLPVIRECGSRLIATSINRFEAISSIKQLLEQERELEQYACEQLRRRRFFPGFFTMLLETS